MCEVRDDSLIDQSQFISTSEGEELAKEIKAEDFIECSAFTRKNIEKVFENAAKIAIQTKKRQMKSCDCREHGVCCVL